MSKIKLNKKYKPLVGSDSRYFIITGGRGSGKSYSVSSFLALLMFEQGHTILYTRYTMSSAHLSIIPEFVTKLESMGIEDYFDVTKDSIVNKATGSKIIFKGIKTSSGDQTAALKSLNGVTTWVLEEAEELIDEETFDKINLSVRQLGKQNRVILLLNPTTKEHWIYQRFFLEAAVKPGSNTIKDQVTYIHTTYQDNIKNLEESFVIEVEKLKDKNPNKFAHVVEGGWMDVAEGVIFNYTIGDFDETLTSVYGQDFGFSVDPTTLTRVAIDKAQKKIYIQECFYEYAQTTSQIAELNASHAGKALIIADSAEPRLIAEVKAKKVNIKAISKTPGSIVTGIGLMQDYELIITPESTNVIKEFNNYVWHDKKSNTPIDDYNHSIDGIRYVVMEMLGNKKVKGKNKFR